MKLYESKETTPLAFYKFFRNVWIPVGVFGCIYSVFFFLLMKNEGLYHVWSVFYAVAVIVLYVFIFWGLLKWKPYTFRLIITILVLFPVGFTINIIYYASNYPNYLFIVMIINACISVVLYSLILIYFYKRKQLFDGVPYKIPNQNEVAKAVPPNFCYQELHLFCVECGTARSSPEYMFCSNCGKEFTNK